MGMSVNSSAAGMAQAMSSVSNMQQIQHAKTQQPAPQVAAVQAPVQPVSQPHGSLGNNIDIRA